MSESVTPRFFHDPVTNILFWARSRASARAKRWELKQRGIVVDVMARGGGYVLEYKAKEKGKKL